MRWKPGCAWIVGAKTAGTLLIAVFSMLLCLATAVRAMPYRSVVINSADGGLHTNSLSPWSGPKAHAGQIPGYKVRVSRLWWEIEDDVRYGVPYLLHNDRRTVIEAILLLLTLGIVVIKSVRRQPNAASQGTGARAQRAEEGSECPAKLCSSGPVKEGERSFSK